MADGSRSFNFPAPQHSRLRPGEIVVDQFAGGGGANEDLKQALGIAPRVRTKSACPTVKADSGRAVLMRTKISTGLIPVTPRIVRWQLACQSAGGVDSRLSGFLPGLELVPSENLLQPAAFFPSMHVSGRFPQVRPLGVPPNDRDKPEGTLSILHNVLLHRMSPERTPIPA